MKDIFMHIHKNELYLEPSASKNHFTQIKSYPWVIIFLCAFFLFYKYVLQVYPSIMTGQLMKEFNIHGFGLGNLVATYFYAYLVTQIFVGVLIDKYSARVLA